MAMLKSSGVTNADSLAGIIRYLESLSFFTFKIVTTAAEIDRLLSKVDISCI